MLCNTLKNTQQKLFFFYAQTILLICVFTKALQKEFHLLTFYPIKMSFTPQYFEKPKNPPQNMTDSDKEDLSYLPVSIKHIYLMETWPKLLLFLYTANYKYNKLTQTHIITPKNYLLHDIIYSFIIFINEYVS